MTFYRLLLITLCSSALFFVVTGCSNSRPRRVPVSGKVSIDGKPLTTGSVRFYSQSNAGRPATGKINADGSFSLFTFELNDGCPLGKFDVAVSSQEAISEMQTKWLIPPKYAEQKTSGITKTIEGPIDNISIELTWAGSGKNGPFITNAQ